MLDQHVDIDALEVEALAARQHRDRHLAHLGGGEDELHMLGRLFQRLEQAGEGRLRQHVHLVEDVDLVAGEVGLVVGAVDQLANIVDAGMRGRVHLDHVEVPALENGAAMGALLAHVEGRPFDAGRFVVQRAGDQPRGGGLADAAHAGEHVGLGDPARGERVGERPDHGLLADQLGEGLGPVFARQRGMAFGSRRGSRRSLALGGTLPRGFILIFDVGHHSRYFRTSCPDPIRASMPLRLSRGNGMDCRVKPGNDAFRTKFSTRYAWGARWEAGRATRETLVRAASFRT